MTENGLNHRLKKNSYHRNHRSLAALDTSNPNYKIVSPTRYKTLNKTSKAIQSDDIKKSFAVSPTFASTNLINSLNFDNDDKSLPLYSIPSRICQNDSFVSPLKMLSQMKRL